eukprot:gnl/Spiro4/27465_TR13662_c0_g3_i1.p1 gnl/Spiro4/27465_TR13662_c0_g3~~gnl/Spiro4/27465_TR13662_c0_g3_i1.p1  ORF type:complete len:391 (-),score=100.85 gnl/Spiro4/27465_TR13662_c0_g3_i1:218-1360(-)
MTAAVRFLVMLALFFALSNAVEVRPAPPRHDAEPKKEKVPDTSPVGLLQEEIRKGNISALEEAVAGGMAVDAQDSENGWTLLFVASEHNQLAIVQWLLERGANANLPDKGNYVPLHVASQAGHLEVVQELLTKGKANVNQKGKGGYTALHFASLRGRTEVATALLAHGAHVDAICEDQWKADRTSLVNAAHFGHVELVKLLLAHGANPNHRCLDGFTPLHAAAEAGQKEVVELLLATGAPINPKREHGVTPLLYAALKGQLETIRMFAERGANVLEKADNGWSTLHATANSGADEAVKFVIELGAGKHVADVDKDMMTPVHLAARRGHTAVLRLLLALDGAKATLNMKNKSGQTPAELAPANSEAASFLEKAEKNQFDEL